MKKYLITIFNRTTGEVLQEFEEITGKRKFLEAKYKARLKFATPPPEIHA